MSVDLNELERLANAATPGPWLALGLMDCLVVVDESSPSGRNIEVADTADSASPAEDAEFIAAARAAVPELIAEVRRLLRANDELRLKLWREERESDALEAEIADWKEATGLTRGGDPGGVTPADLRTHIQALSRVERAAWRLVKMTVHDRGRCHPSMVGEETCYLCDLATAVNALPKEAP